MDARRRHSLVPYVAVPMLLLLAYVLSYAPMFRVASGWESEMVLPDGGPLGIYRPVDWMTDREPLKRPLLWWANVCGVEVPFSLASDMRTGKADILFHSRLSVSSW